MEIYMPLAAGEGLIVALLFAGAIVLVGATAFLMRWLERSRQQKLQDEMDVRKAAAKSEAERIIAQAQTEAKSELLRLRVNREYNLL